MKIKFFSILIIISFYISPFFAKSPPNTVVAYVDNAIITLSDLEQFAKFKTIVDKNSIDFNFSKADLLAMREELIKQNIQLQEVKAFCKDMLKKKYFISVKEVTDFISSIAKQYDKTYDDYIASISRHGIGSEIIKNYWETRLAWSKYLQYMYSAMINISDMEIENIISSHEAQIEGTKYKLSKIVVPINKQNPENAITIISEIHDKLLKGEKFSKLLQNNKNKSGASLGWVAAQSLDKNTLTVIQTLQKGEFSNYFQENDNFVIYYLEDKVAGQLIDKIIKTRIILVKDLEQFELEEVSYLTKNSSSIKEFFSSLKEKKLLQKVKVMEQQTINLSEIEPDFAEFLQQFKKGEITPFVNSPQGLMIFCIDDRKDVVQKISKEQIREMLFEQKLSEYSQKRLKDLMRTAHIDRIDF